VTVGKLEAAERKSRVLIVCAHEPRADPRIWWAARSAAAAFEVTVLGLASDDNDHSDDCGTGEYEIVRLQRSSVGASSYLWLMKDVAPGAASVGLATLIVLGSPFLIMAEATLSLASKAMRYAARSRSGSLRHLHQANGTPTPGLLQFRRGRWLRRVRFIFAVMRYQFAPAAAVFGAWIGSLEDKPDVIHCNDLDTLLVGILAKKRFGSRIIYDAHEFYSESHPEGHWLEIKLLTALERFLVRKADVVITVSPMLAEVMRNAYDLPRVYSVPNAEWWIEPRDRPPIKAMMTPLARERIKVLFQGRFASGRGIEELIEGWARVDGTKAALFLRGPDNIWRQAAIALARKLDLLDKSVYFLEAVPEHMLVPAAMEADVGVIPYKPLITNDRFACPNKLSQYMHAGLMVVANDLPYVKSVIQAAGAGLSYDSSDPSSLAAIIGRVVADRNLVRRCQESALRYAKETFNWQIHGETLNTLYRGPSPAMVCNSPEPRGSRLLRRVT
jgi:glycosyltransferase involved in cell wall biosynthesis